MSDWKDKRIAALEEGRERHGDLRYEQGREDERGRTDAALERVKVLEKERDHEAEQRDILRHRVKTLDAATSVQHEGLWQLEKQLRAGMALNEKHAEVIHLQGKRIEELDEQLRAMLEAVPGHVGWNVTRRKAREALEDA